MNINLNISINHVEGALIRLLGTIERHHLSFHAALPSLQGCFEPVRRATHG